MNIKNTLRPISAIELCDDCERIISCGFCLYCDEPTDVQLQADGT